mmetsp:Transcript_22114/g.77496  ORF Transcript_22114/g.77496 Transcript_22114/m.77496 type:complete len:668 (-) Transcript_22114:130-2133(-)
MAAAGKHDDDAHDHESVSDASTTRRPSDRLRAQRGRGEGKGGEGKHGEGEGGGGGGAHTRSGNGGGAMVGEADADRHGEGHDAKDDGEDRGAGRGGARGCGGGETARRGAGGSAGARMSGGDDSNVGEEDGARAAASTISESASSSQSVSSQASGAGEVWWSDVKDRVTVCVVTDVTAMPYANELAGAAALAKQAAETYTHAAMLERLGRLIDDVHAGDPFVPARVLRTVDAIVAEMKDSTPLTEDEQRTCFTVFMTVAANFSACPGLPFPGGVSLSWAEYTAETTGRRGKPNADSMRLTPGPMVSNAGLPCEGGADGVFLLSTMCCGRGFSFRRTFTEHKRFQDDLGGLSSSSKSNAGQFIAQADSALIINPHNKEDGSYLHSLHIAGNCREIEITVLRQLIRAETGQVGFEALVRKLLITDKASWEGAFQETIAALRWHLNVDLGLTRLPEPWREQAPPDCKVTATWLPKKPLFGRVKTARSTSRKSSRSDGSEPSGQASCRGSQGGSDGSGSGASGSDAGASDSASDDAGDGGGRTHGTPAAGGNGVEARDDVGGHAHDGGKRSSSEHRRDRSLRDTFGKQAMVPIVPWSPQVLETSAGAPAATTDSGRAEAPAATAADDGAAPYSPAERAMDVWKLTHASIAYRGVDLLRGRPLKEDLASPHP